MGIDVNLYAKGQVTAAGLAASEAFMVERFGEDDYGDAWLVQCGGDYYEDGGDRIEFCTLSRYYGPGYERGHWPTIYGYIRAMKAAFPALSIHYGGDTDEDCPEATDSETERIWEHWLGPHGNDYHREAEAWNAAAAARHA